MLCLGLAIWVARPPAWAQDSPILEIALYPGIRLTGELGTTYVIESKTEVEGASWMTRGWIELTTPTTIWIDPVPTDSPRRMYRAVKVTKPVVQTIANMVWIPPGTFLVTAALQREVLGMVTRLARVVPHRQSSKTLTHCVPV